MLKIIGPDQQYKIKITRLPSGYAGYWVDMPGQLVEAKSLPVLFAKLNGVFNEFEEGTCGGTGSAY